MEYSNIGREIVARAYAQPDSLAFVGPTSLMSRRRFADLVLSFARHMQRCGVGRGSRVGIVVQSPMVNIVALAAVALLGAACRKGTGSDELPLTHVFAGLGESDMAPYVFARSWFEAPEGSVDDLDQFEGHASPADPWLLMSSSGTTGTPKTIPLRYDDAFTRIVERPDLQDGKPPISLNLFNAGSYGGFKARLNHVAAGGTCIERQDWDALVELGVTRVLGSPSHLAGLMSHQPPPAVRLRCCRVAGAAATHKFVEHALRYFEEVQVVYASTEAGMVSEGRFSHEHPYDGSAGIVEAKAEVQIVDAEGRPVAPGVEGQLRLRSAGMAQEYHGEPELSAQVFSKGWFHPGDMGTLGADGRLHITGRIGDVINVDGTKLNAIAFDEVIQLHPAVADGFCFVEPSRSGLTALAAIVTPRPGQAAQLGTLRSFARERWFGGKILRRLYIPTSSPATRTASRCGPRRRGSPRALSVPTSNSGTDRVLRPYPSRAATSSGDKKMKKLLLASMAVLALGAAPAMAQSDSGAVVGGTAGGVSGAVAGGLIFGPIGAIIGGFTGAVIGASVVSEASVEYVRANPTEPVVIEGNIEAGFVVPDTVELHVIETDPDYGYFYTNDRVFFVKLSDRTVVYSPGIVVAAQ